MYLGFIFSRGTVGLDLREFKGCSISGMSAAIATRTCSLELFCVFLTGFIYFTVPHISAVQRSSGTGYHFETDMDDETLTGASTCRRRPPRREKERMRMRVGSVEGDPKKRSWR